jgi:hypothetical protein
MEYKGIIPYTYLQILSLTPNIHEGSAAPAAIQIRPETGSIHFRQLLLCSYTQHLDSAQEISSIDSKARVTTKLKNTLFNPGRIFKNKSN